MRRLYTATLLAVLSAPALAAGPEDPVFEPVIAPTTPAQPIWDFSGLYGGTAIGTGTFTLNADDDDDPFEDVEDLFDAIDDDDSAAHYQAHLGYNFVRGRLVFGPELAFFNGESEVGENFVIDGVDAASDAEIGFGVRLVGRAGVQFGRVLPYLAAGATHMEIESDDDDLSDTGLAYGLGAEVLVTERFVLGIEYMQSDFDGFDDSEVDVDYETISLKASFKF